MRNVKMPIVFVRLHIAFTLIIYILVPFKFSQLLLLKSSLKHLL
jgi:hypothetical protein